MNYSKPQTMIPPYERDVHDVRWPWLVGIPLDSFDRERHEPLAHLSADEIKRANRYRCARRRNAYIAGRAAMKWLLSHRLRCPPETLQLCLNAHGKPFARCNDGTLFSGFSLSHSPSQIVVGITSGDAIGVDVEDFQRRLPMDLLARNFFSESQQEQWLNHPVEVREHAFLRGWTRKEAAWKLFGNETCVAWNDIEVTLEDTAHTFLRASTATGESFLLDCYTWQPSTDSVASVVIRHRPGNQLLFEASTIDFDKPSELVWMSEDRDRLRSRS